jgi:exodeoxyribonuclease VIII
MIDLMIDLETIGTDPTTTVISLGACFFDLETGKIGPTFYMALDVDEQLKKGRSLDGSTLKWWMGQSGAAKKVFNEKAKSADEVLRTFSTWVLANCQISKVKPWGNGATFDISIMENMYRMYGIKCPWMYNSIMDLRTFRRFIANGDKVDKSSGVDHNALDDAINQANFVIRHNKFFKEMIAAFEQIKNNVDNKV